MVLTICVGGMFLGTLLASVSALTDDAMPMTDRLVGLVYSAPTTGFAGGWLGLAEGLLLGLPLAAAPRAHRRTQLIFAQ